MPNVTKNQQTSHHLGGCASDIEIALMLAQGLTPAQMAFRLGVLPADVVRVLALPTPT
jgi:hypothetical protein